MRPGDRVEIHPGTDAWMRGDRYGTVTSIGCSRKSCTDVHVHMDKSGEGIALPGDRWTVVS